MENAQSIIFQMQKVGKHMMEKPRKLCETQNVHEEKGDSIQPTPSLRGIICHNWLVVSGSCNVHENRMMIPDHQYTFQGVETTNKT